MTGGEAPAVDANLQDDFERLAPLEGVKAYPTRVKCATLAWHAFETALKNGAVGATVKTDNHHVCRRRIHLLQNNPAPAGEGGGVPSDGPHEPERPSSTETNEELLPTVLEALRTVRDPEIPVNLVDLRLVYELIVNKDGIVYVEMTLTAYQVGELPGQVKEAIEAVEGIKIAFA